MKRSKGCGTPARCRDFMLVRPCDQRSEKRCKRLVILSGIERVSDRRSCVCNNFLSVLLRRPNDDLVFMSTLKTSVPCGSAKLTRLFSLGGVIRIMRSHPRYPRYDLAQGLFPWDQGSKLQTQSQWIDLRIRGKPAYIHNCPKALDVYSI